LYEKEIAIGIEKKVEGCVVAGVDDA